MGPIIPIAIIELILLIIAIVDCIRVRRTRGPKWLWFIIIVVFGILGPIAYFLFGRDNR